VLMDRILQVENGPGRTDCWWIDILPMEDGPGWKIVRGQAFSLWRMVQVDRSLMYHGQLFC
jgi:hypothetical protein